MDREVALALSVAGFLAACGPTARPAPGPGIEPRGAVSIAEPSYADDRCGAPVPVGGTRVLWAARIGLTSYRSTLLVNGGQVIVGSNGDAWHEKDDPCDGIYVLDARSGKLVRHVVPPEHPAGDQRDVTGVALAENGALIFGTDQGVLMKAAADGKIAWTQTLGGDVEAAPALADFDGDGVLDAAVGAELGDFFAVSGATGKVLYRVPTGTGDYNQRGFVTAAALGDVTGDGVADIFAPGRDGTMRAIDGQTGAILWQREHDSSLHAAPILVDEDGDGTRELIYAAVYSELFSVDAKTGSERWRAELKHPGSGIEGLFSPVSYFAAARCAVVSTAWWKHNEGVYCVSAGKTRWRFEEPSENIVSGAVFGDVDGKPGAELVIATESGWVLGLDTGGKRVWDFHIGSPIEMAPAVADVNGDGLNEVLVGANDGILRAILTDGRAPAAAGYFRGDVHNTGRWPVKRSQAAARLDDEVGQ